MVELDRILMRMCEFQRAPHLARNQNEEMKVCGIQRYVLSDDYVKKDHFPATNRPLFDRPKKRSTPLIYFEKNAQVWSWARK